MRDRYNNFKHVCAHPLPWAGCLDIPIISCPIVLCCSVALWWLVTSSASSLVKVVFPGGVGQWRGQWVAWGASWLVFSQFRHSLSFLAGNRREGAVRAVYPLHMSSTEMTHPTLIWEVSLSPSLCAIRTATLQTIAPSSLSPIRLVFPYHTYSNRCSVYLLPAVVP